MKIDTFTAFTVTSMIALSVAFAAMNADASEPKASPVNASTAKSEDAPKRYAPVRYKHKCSKSIHKPTLVPVDRPLRRSTVSIETGRYYPGVKKPHMNVIQLDNGNHVIEAVFIHMHTRKRCVYRNKSWTVAKKPG